jgi:hypothetical protein
MKNLFRFLKTNYKKSTCVLILGMHRSGTSSLAGSLQTYGLYLGQVYESNPYNLKGNRENAGVMELNEAILTHNKSRWDAPPDTLQWTPEHEQARENILKGFLASRRPVWGFKDPRLLLTLDFWLEGLKDICSVQMAGTFRRPEAVAGSLLKRDDIPLSQGYGLWESYNIRLYQLLQQNPFPLTCFDLSPNAYQHDLNRIASRLQLTRPARETPSFFDESLRHEDDNSTSTKAPESAQTLYKNISEIYRAQTG